MSDGPVENRAPVLLGVSWMWTALGTLFVAARFYTRLTYTRKLWWDDFWAAVTLVFSYCMSITWTVYANKGGAQHAWTLTPEQAVDTARLNWISQPFCIYGLAAGRLAVGALIMRLQSPTKWRSILLWVLLTIMCCYNSVEIVLVFTQCRPVYALWDPESAPDAVCMNPAIVTNNAIALSSWCAFLDLALAAIPAHMIWNLQLPRGRKLAISALLSTGIFAFVMAVVKITALSNDSEREDITWATVLLFVWNACEVNVVLVATCIPCLMPLFEAVTGRHPVTKYGKKSSAHNYSSPARHGYILPAGGNAGGSYLDNKHELTNIRSKSRASDGDSEDVLVERPGQAGYHSQTRSHTEQRGNTNVIRVETRFGYETS